MTQIKSKMRFYTKNREKVNWKVPSLFNNDELIFLLHDTCKELEIRQPVNSVFGSVKSSWSGGRVSDVREIDRDKAFYIISQYNNRNISCCFTFSNYHINKEDLYDSVGNLLLDIANNSGYPNYAIVTSDVLAEYIRNKYPNIKLTSSIIKPIYDNPDFNDTPEYYNKLCERYDNVVVRCEFYSDKKFMKQLKHKQQIELLLNIGCFKKCTLAKTHYENVVKLENEQDTIYKQFCHKDMNDIRNIYNIASVCNEDIDNLVKMGFYNLKLKGRGATDKELMQGIIGRYIFEPTGYFQHIEKYTLDILQRRKELVLNNI